MHRDDVSDVLSIEIFDDKEQAAEADQLTPICDAKDLTYGIVVCGVTGWIF